MIEPKKVTFDSEGESVTIELTDEFEKAFDLIENTNESFFITGKAGTGKSTLLRYFRSQTNKQVAVVAFTGLAAINVNGQTIHSFFGFPIGFIHPNQVKRSDLLEPIIRALDILVIDEVSMLRADLMDAIDKSLRIHRNSDVSFGGVQMVFIGDMYQLPPIVEKDLGDVYSRYYKTPYFFSADVFSQRKFPLINLEKIHRQNDPVFIDILNSIRERRNLPSALAKLNSSVQKHTFDEVQNGDTIFLTTTNEKVREINSFFLNRLDTEEYQFRAAITGDFDPKSFPTEERLYLKEGSKVMFVKNDPEKFYVNGDVGIITKLLPFSIEVKCKGARFILKKLEWDKIKYKYVPSEIEGEKGSVKKTTIGTFEQYPIRLAWAITVHKSQGQTYNNVIIDMHTGSFTSGQTYVALSRCRTLNGIKLQRPIRESDIILDHRITEFHRIFEEI